MSPRSDLLASLVTFHVRLWLGGLFLALLVPVSLVAAALNFLAGTGPEDGPYGSIHRRAVAFDGWLKTVGQEPGRSRVATDDAPSEEVPRRHRGARRVL